MSVGDLLQLTIEATYKYLIPILNVFHYYHYAGTHSPEEICAEFVNKPLFQIRAMFYGDVHFETLRLRNLFDPSYGIDYAVGLDGSRPGLAEELPTHDAAAIRMRHGNAAIRGGFKRFGAPTEMDQLDGALEAAYLVYLNNVASAILDNLFPGVGGPTTDDLQYCIVKRILEDPGPPKVYRLPENLGEAAWGVVTATETRPRVTTQNTRKLLAL